MLHIKLFSLPKEDFEFNFWIKTSSIVKEKHIHTQTTDYRIFIALLHFRLIVCMIISSHAWWHTLVSLQFL